MRKSWKLIGLVYTDFDPIGVVSSPRSRFSIPNPYLVMSYLIEKTWKDAR